MTYATTRRTAALALFAFAAPKRAIAQAAEANSGDPLTVEVSAVVLPVVRGTALVNYLFGVIQIQMADAASTFFLREQSYLLRDAIIRIASRAPIPAGSTPKSFDRVAVTRVVLQAIQSVRPSARVVRVTVLGAAFMRN